MDFRKPAALCVLFLFPAIALPQVRQRPIALSEYQKQEWHVEDGLPQGNVRAITQAPGRLLMIGTSEGMASFNGIKFAPFHLNSANGPKNEPVNAILYSRSAELWIGTDDRGVLVQRGNEVVAISEESSFYGERIRALYEDRAGGIWAATQNGVERIANRKIQALHSLGLVSGDCTAPFAEDGRGNVFFITSKGVFVWNGSKAAEFPVNDASLGSATAAYSNRVGTIWIGFTRGLLRLTTAPNGEYARQKIATPHVITTALAEDRDGSLWVGTKGKGIYRVAPSGEIASWTSNDGLPDDTVRSLYVDDEGSLWIGMLSGGINRWRQAALLPFGKPEGFGSSYAATVLGDSKGDIWLGSWGNGLWRLHFGELRKEHLPGMPDNAHIRALTEDSKANIWIGSWFYGIYRYDGKTLQHFLTGNESMANATSAITFDRKGNLWVGTYKGLIRYTSSKPEKSHEELFLPGKLVTAIKEDRDGSLVVGTFDGLYRVKDSSLEPIGQKDGLANPFILSVSRDDAGNIWIGTKAGGVDLLRGSVAVHIGSSQGLVENPVLSVLDDGNGVLWLSTTRGLLKVPREQMLRAADGKKNVLDAVLLGKSDGMRSSECGGQSQPPASRTSDGALWFATAKGFVHTSPSATAAPLPTLEPHVTGFQIGSVEAPPTEKVVLKSGLANFRLYFDAVRLANPSQLQFRYKLDGYDRAWTTSLLREARYQNLPPGTYRFFIAARDEGHDWANPVAQVTVVQRPFFYQTAWFYFAIFLSLAAMVFALLRWREFQIRGRLRLVAEERNRIAREWHDTIMAGLAAISWQLEATADQLNRGREATSKSLNLARNMVRHCQSEGRRIIWDLHQTESPVGSLSEALNRALGGMQRSPKVDAKLSVRGTESILSPVVIHQLVCICQEAVSNALRHGEPTAIEVALDYRDSLITLSVSDDGRGFEKRAENTPGHFGLSVMGERARKLGGELHVRSALGAGTQVLVEVPVPEQAGAK